MNAPRPVLLAALVLAVVLGVYSGALAGPFLWDDRHLILHSELVREPRPLWDYFRLPFWSGAENGPSVSIHYRPLAILTLAFDQRIHADNPSGFHLSNLILHGVNVLLVFLLARKRGASALAGAFAAAAFGLLPRLCEAAAWISGRTDLLATAFTLSALLVWHRDGRLRRWLSALLLLLGLFSKEVAIAGFFALLVLTLLEKHQERIWARLPRLLPLGLALLAYGVLRVSATLDAPSVELPAAGRIATFFEAIGRYVVMTIDLFRPRTQQGQVLVVSWGFVLLGAIALPLLGFALFRWRRRLSAEAWSLIALGGVAIGLVLHAVPLSISVVSADRFLYLPMAALLVLLAPALDVLRAARPVVAAAGAGGILLGLAWRTSERVADFADEARFWHDAVRTTPESNGLPAVELGGVYYRAALYRNALALYRRAASAPDSHLSGARANLAICLGWLGAYGEARALIEQAISARPSVPKFRLDHALIELHDLNFRAARALATSAVRLHPRYEQAKSVAELALELEREAPALLGDRTGTGSNLRYERARFLSRAGRYPEAVRAWRALLDAPGLDAPSASAAWEYLIRFAEPELLREAARAGHRPPAALAPSLGARMQLVGELEAAWKAAGLRRRDR